MLLKPPKAFVWPIPQRENLHLADKPELFELIRSAAASGVEAAALGIPAGKWGRSHVAGFLSKTFKYVIIGVRLFSHSYD
jgi:hypothetical protein